jgi:MFS family permease
MQRQRLRTWLTRTSGPAFSIYAMTAAFSTYAFMYAFRKPFTAATYAGEDGLWGVDYKTWLIIAQVIGYTISKFLGIKVVSEIPAARRAIAIVASIAVAELALVLFAVTPAPWNIACLFLNGLPLGMIWGIVFSFLEGRRFSDMLAAGLNASYILASGVVKSVGAWVMEAFGVPEFAMPYVTGAIFLIPLLVSVWLLAQLPPPTAEDEAARTKRQPMHAAERRRLFLSFAAGIVLLTVAYMALTAYRDLRDNFSRELWDALGYERTPGIFSLTEIPVALAVLPIIAAVTWVKRNLRAFLVTHVIILAGALLIGFATLAFQLGVLHPTAWMILIGVGVYMGYVPFNSVLFDRFFAAFRFVGTAGFLIYIADSFGYLASVGVLLYRNFGRPDLSWYDFFIQASYATAISGVVLTLASAAWFLRRHRRLGLPDEPPAPAPAADPAPAAAADPAPALAPAGLAAPSATAPAPSPAESSR